MSSFSSEPHPEELSRRISEIDLTHQRSYTLTSESAEPVADTTTLEDAAPANLRYSREELLQLAPEGVASPAQPNPPPSTPIELPLTPPDETGETQLAGQNQNVQAPAHPAKKKKKSGGGKNKKAAPTGFEGLFHTPQKSILY